MADTEPIGHFEYIKCYDQIEMKSMTMVDKEDRDICICRMGCAANAKRMGRLVREEAKRIATH